VKINILYILLATVTISAQTKIELRDLYFNVPNEFKQINKENVLMEYDAFYENGKIFVDSTDTVDLPIILYQYYENPSAGEDHSGQVLKNLNAIMSKDVKSDTLLINEQRDFSIAKYRIKNKTLYEVKSLGEKGWLNVQLLDKIDNDKSNFQKMLFIAESIKHSGSYGGKYKERMDSSANASKWFFVAFIFYLFVHFIRKWNKKKSPDSSL
jgi:hypothetical protein